MNDFNSDTLAGMAEAQQRHSGGMLPAQIEQQYSQLCQVDYSQKTPAQVPADTEGTVDFRRMAGGIAALGALSAAVYVAINTVAAVVAAVHAFCAANIVLVGGGAVGLSALLLFFAGRSGGGETEAKGGGNNYYYYNNHYYDQRNFNKK